MKTKVSQVYELRSEETQTEVTEKDFDVNMKATQDLDEVYKTLKDDTQILADKCQILDHKSAPRSEHQKR